MKDIVNGYCTTDHENIEKTNSDASQCESLGVFYGSVLVSEKLLGGRYRVGRLRNFHWTYIAMYLSQIDLSVGWLGTASFIGYLQRSFVGAPRVKRHFTILTKPKFQHIARAVLTFAFSQRYIVKIPVNVYLIPLTKRLHILRSGPS